MLVRLILIAILVFVVLTVLSRLSRRLPDGAARSGTFPYFARGSLLTPAERSFLGVLEQAVAGRYRVFAKVRLADLLAVEPRTPDRDRGSADDRIERRHVDFALCRPTDLSVAAVIVLDDAPRPHDDRLVRDAFVEQACRAAGLTLLRLPAAPGYSVEQLRGLLDGLGVAAPELPTAS